MAHFFATFGPSGWGRWGRALPSGRLEGNDERATGEGEPAKPKPRRSSVCWGVPSYSGPQGTTKYRDLTLGGEYMGLNHYQHHFEVNLRYIRL